MQKTTATAGGGGAVYGGYELYSQSWDWWMDALPMVTIVGYGLALIMALALFALWKRVKALEAKQ
jgi:hypothetical protein